jgi:hypothetical protein
MTSAPLRSSLGWSTPSEICVYGHDLPGELLGTIDFGGMTFLAFTGAMPTREIWERTDDEVTQDQLARRAAVNGSERKEGAES